MYAPFSGDPSIDVTIEVPTGSRLHGTASMCRFLVTGELGQCELKTSAIPGAAGAGRIAGLRSAHALRDHRP
jgi:hypothetical protein